MKHCFCWHVIVRPNYLKISTRYLSWQQRHLRWAAFANLYAVFIFIFFIISCMFLRMTYHLIPTWVAAIVIIIVVIVVCVIDNVIIIVVAIIISTSKIWNILDSLKSCFVANVIRHFLASSGVPSWLWCSCFSNSALAIVSNLASSIKLRCFPLCFER